MTGNGGHAPAGSAPFKAPGRHWLSDNSGTPSYPGYDTGAISTQQVNQQANQQANQQQPQPQFSTVSHSESHLNADRTLHSTITSGTLAPTLLPTPPFPQNVSHQSSGTNSSLAEFGTGLAAGGSLTSLQTNISGSASGNAPHSSCMQTPQTPQTPLMAQRQQRTHPYEHCSHIRSLSTPTLAVKQEHRGVWPGYDSTKVAQTDARAIQQHYPQLQQQHRQHQEQQQPPSHSQSHHQHYPLQSGSTAQLQPYAQRGGLQNPPQFAAHEQQNLGGHRRQNYGLYNLSVSPSSHPPVHAPASTPGMYRGVPSITGGRHSPNGEYFTASAAAECGTDVFGMQPYCPRSGPGLSTAALTPQVTGSAREDLNSPAPSSHYEKYARSYGSKHDMSGAGSLPGPDTDSTNPGPENQDEDETIESADGRRYSHSQYTTSNYPGYSNNNTDISNTGSYSNAIASSNYTGANYYYSACCYGNVQPAYCYGPNGMIPLENSFSGPCTGTEFSNPMGNSASAAAAAAAAAATAAGNSLLGNASGNIRSSSHALATPHVGLSQAELGQRRCSPSYVPRHPLGPLAVTDPTGQMAPPGAVPRILEVQWHEQETCCYQVVANGVYVARREDNNMVNGTKLLNVTGMSRGRRDRILKAGTCNREVVKSGPMHFKGVWIPLEYALALANRERITDMLYPLFVMDVKQLLEDRPEISLENPHFLLL